VEPEVRIFASIEAGASRGGRFAEAESGGFRGAGVLYNVDGGEPDASVVVGGFGGVVAGLFEGKGHVVSAADVE
jgi:hypothetical protein